MKRTFLLCTFVLAMTCLLVSCDPAQRDLENQKRSDMDAAQKRMQENADFYSGKSGNENMKTVDPNSSLAEAIKANNSSSTSGNENSFNDVMSNVNNIASKILGDRSPASEHIERISKVADKFADQSLEVIDASVGTVSEKALADRKDE